MSRPLRRPRRRPLGRAATAVTALAVAATASTLVTGPASQAADADRARQVATDYGFQGTAYGTRVFSDVVALESGKSAYSYLGCTRTAGERRSETLAAIDLPADSPTIQVDGVASRNRTWVDKAGGVLGGVTSINEIARVRLGSADTPRLTIEGLRSQSTAWANANDRLRAENKVTATDINLVNLESSPLPGSPLDDLLDSLDEGIDEVLQTLIENGGTIEIPGLGEISVGYERLSQKKNFAVAGSFVLKVLLYGPDAGPGDDSLVGIGHSRARINRGLPAAVMSGVGYGASAQVLDGVLAVGKLGNQPLPCRGTNGEVLQAPVAGLDLGGADQLTAAGVTGRAAGQQFENGRAWAWTQGEVANLTLGPLEIRAIRGRANVEQDRSGRVFKKNIGGSRIGEILVDGESQGAFTPANASEIPELEIPGVADIDFFVTEKGTRGVTTSAVVLTLLEDTPGVSEVRLGNAQVKLRR